MNTNTGLRADALRGQFGRQAVAVVIQFSVGISLVSIADSLTA